MVKVILGQLGRLSQGALFFLSVVFTISAGSTESRQTDKLDFRGGGTKKELLKSLPAGDKNPTEKASQNFNPVTAQLNQIKDSTKTAEENSQINPETDQDFKPNTASNKKDVEKIKVTGSRVRRIDLEGPSPLIIFTKEDLENSGYFSVPDFLKNTSLSNFGESLIHSRSTLTLVNGARLVYDSAVDFIPPSAIERIEVLKDGASALYGSDVVGGVINIITKKDLGRPELSFKLSPTLYPFYKGGQRAESSIVFGKKFLKWHFLSSFQFQYHEDLKRSERPKLWYNDYYLPYSPHPSFQIGSQIIIDPKCPSALKTQTGCNHNFVPYVYFQPETYYFANYNYAEYSITSDLSFYSSWKAFWQRSKEKRQPILDQLQIPAGHQMSLGTGKQGVLKYIFQDSWRDEITDYYFLDGLIGFKGWISKTWDFDWSLKWSNLWHRLNYKNHFYKEDIVKAIMTGVYDPFDPKKRDFSSVRLHDALYTDNDTRFFSSLDFSGSAVWDLDMAVGFQAYYNRYKNTADSKVKAGKIYALAPAETGDQKRYVAAGYAEAVKHFSDWLEIQLAGRVDRYSDFGWTFNPKTAVRLQFQNNFLIRSSLGTSFTAPSLTSLYRPRTTAYPIIYDTVACYNELESKGYFKQIQENLKENKLDTGADKNKLIKEFLIEQSGVLENKKLSKKSLQSFKDLAGKLGGQEYCRGRSVKGVAVGNKDLKPGRAFTASFGFHWEWNEDHSLTVDYWYNYLNASPLDSFDSKKTIDAELRHGKAYVEKQKVQYERDPEHPYKAIKAGTPVETTINIAQKKLSGLDLIWESDFPRWTLAGGHFYFKNDFAYVFNGSIETFPGMGFINTIGKFGLPKWRNFARLGWKNRKHNLSFLLKSTAGTKKAYKQFEKLKTSSLIDLFYQYTISIKSMVKFGWYNAFLAEPVIDDSITQGLKFDSSFFEPLGSYFFVDFRYKF